MCEAISEESEIYADIQVERSKQIARWGDQFHTNSQWFLIESEELGEVARDILDGQHINKLRTELVQVAAVAVAWINDLDKRYGYHNQPEAP